MKESRGFSTIKLTGVSKEEALKLIDSVSPIQRTNGYRAFEEHFIDSNEDALFLLNKLISEKKLYPRLAIQYTLAQGKENTVNVLIDNIKKAKCAKISASSKKQCYPLSRNLISRIIGCMDEQLFPCICEKIINLDDESTIELVEGI